MKYIGSARNIRELIKLLDRLDSSSEFEIECQDDRWSYVEVWYDEPNSTVVFK